MPELLCPVCGAALAFDERTARCGSGHQYDRAKSGYVNLLISRQSGAQHGDDKEMVRARRAFLEQGYYAPLRRRLCETALHWTPQDQTDLLDAGCGECYYTAAVAAALTESGRTVHGAGVDISKDALRWGGNRDRSLRLAVASVSRLPVADASCDLVLNVFAPFAGAEYLRVLKPGGVLLHVSPEADHLWELKQTVYDQSRLNDALPPEQAGLTIAAEETLRFCLHLPSNEDITNLFAMTPYAHKTSPKAAARLGKVDALDVTAAFRLRVYQKEDASPQR